MANIRDNESGYTSKRSDSNYSRSSSMNQGSIEDKVNEYVTQLIEQAFRTLQPRVKEFVTHLTSRAVNVSDQSARQLINRARDNRAYVIGAAALLVIGLGMFLGRGQSSGMSSQELH